MSRMDEGMGTGTGGQEGSQGQGGQAGGQLRDSAQQVQQSLRDLGGQAREVAQQRYEDLRRQAGDYYDQGRQRAQEWEQGLEQYIHEKPLQAVMIAAGVGVLLGLLWKRS